MYFFICKRVIYSCLHIFVQFLQLYCPFWLSICLSIVLRAESALGAARRSKVCKCLADKGDIFTPFL